MSRASRLDEAGSIHHVYARGIARRTVFEEEADVRLFLALLAREIRRGTIRLLAFAFLTTHFHLLIESVVGDLGGAMRRVLSPYVRWFNRGRRRDGPLFRSRYGSRVVRSSTYLERVVRYIDQNAPEARLAASPGAYPYGSAWHYARPRRPRWLAAADLDRIASRSCATTAAARYAKTFHPRLRGGDAFLVEERMRRPASLDDGAPWDLLRAAAPKVLARMRRKIHVADGFGRPAPRSDPRTVDRICARAPADVVRRPTGTSRGAEFDSQALRVALLRELCALSYLAIARRASLTIGQVRLRLDRHATRVPSDARYRELVATLKGRCCASYGSSPVTA